MKTWRTESKSEQSSAWASRGQFCSQMKRYLPPCPWMKIYFYVDIALFAFSFLQSFYHLHPVLCLYGTIMLLQPIPFTVEIYPAMGTFTHYRCFHHLNWKGISKGYQNSYISPYKGFQKMGVSKNWRRVRNYTNTNAYDQTYQHKSKKHKNFIMLYVPWREHIWYIKAVHGHSFFQTCMLRQALQKDVSQRWVQRPGGRVPSPTGLASVEPSPQAAFPKRQKWRKSPRYNN